MHPLLRFLRWNKKSGHGMIKYKILSFRNTYEGNNNVR